MKPSHSLTTPDISRSPVTSTRCVGSRHAGSPRQRDRVRSSASCAVRRAGTCGRTRTGWTKCRARVSIVKFTDSAFRPPSRRRRAAGQVAEAIAPPSIGVPEPVPDEEAADRPSRPRSKCPSPGAHHRPTMLGRQRRLARRRSERPRRPRWASSSHSMSSRCCSASSRRCTPTWCGEAGIDGTVFVQVLVGKDGKVKQAVADRGARSAHVRRRRRGEDRPFQPALQATSPVEVWVQVPIRSRSTASGRAAAFPPATRSRLDAASGPGLRSRIYPARSLAVTNNLMLPVAGLQEGRRDRNASSHWENSMLHTPLISRLGAAQIRAALAALLCAVSSPASLAPAAALASELDLQIPAIDTTYSSFGLTVSGWPCCTSAWRVRARHAVRADDVPRSRRCRRKAMLDVSHIIYETCKAYLLQQGQLLAGARDLHRRVHRLLLRLPPAPGRRHASRHDPRCSRCSASSAPTAWRGSASA